VLTGSETAGNVKIADPGTAHPAIVSVTGVLEPGGRTSCRQHPVPVFGYVLEGTLAVQTHGGPPREYVPGEAFLEDVNPGTRPLTRAPRR
jgi:quercetin dioxygenase-like cupin family protein